MVVSPSFRYSNEFTEGLAAVEPYDQSSNLVGFIDKVGSYTLPPAYEIVGTFRKSLCLVALAEEIAYIDRAGSVVWRGPFVDVGRISEL